MTPCSAKTPMIEGVAGYGVDRAFDVIAVINASDRMRVAITRLGLCDLLAIRSITVLVDARMRKHMVTPDLSHLAGITVGLGPGFEVGGNCDVAVETRPARIGQVVQQGATDEADGKPPSLGGAGRERFVYARSSGLWRTAFDIGAQVRAGAALGYLADRAVMAPINGTLRGIVRDATTVPSGVKLLEVDPRGQACWIGIDERGRRIALAAMRAIAVQANRYEGREDLKQLHWNSAHLKEKVARVGRDRL